MTPPVEDVCPNDDWAERIVEASAFRHLVSSPRCVGYTVFTGGRAACFAHDCGWAISWRVEDGGERRIALFSMIALGTIGLAVQSAICAGAWGLIASLDDLEAVAAAIQIAIDGPKDGA